MTTSAISPISRPAPRMATAFAGFNPANVAAGLSVIIIYAAGPFPFYLATVASSGLDQSVARAGLLLAFFTAGVATLALCLIFRQPLALGWSMPGLVYLAAASHRYTADELVGACVVTAALLTVLAVTGSAEKLARWLPTPLVMAVLAGSAIHFCTGVFVQLEGSVLVVGVPIAAYFIARGAGRTWLPPIGVALIAGLPFALLAGGGAAPVVESATPRLLPLMPSFALEPIVTLVPLLLASTILGNIQGFAVLEMNGFRPPRNATTLAISVVSFVHALFAAPPATMQRASLAIFAGEESGSPESRHNAAIIASVGAILLAILAISLASVVMVLPPAFVATLMGLVLFPIVMEALQRSLGSDAPQGAFVAFAVTTSGVTIIGLDAALWGLVGGFAVSALVERPRKQAQT